MSRTPGAYGFAGSEMTAKYDPNRTQTGLEDLSDRAVDVHVGQVVRLHRPAPAVKDRHRLAVRKAANQITGRLAGLSEGQIADFVAIVLDPFDQPGKLVGNLLTAIAGRRWVVERLSPSI